jgi:hypothetical protein
VTTHPKIPQWGTSPKSNVLHDSAPKPFCHYMCLYQHNEPSDILACIFYMGGSGLTMQYPHYDGNINNCQVLSNGLKQRTHHKTAVRQVLLGLGGGQREMTHGQLLYTSDAFLFLKLKISMPTAHSLINSGHIKNQCLLFPCILVVQLSSLSAKGCVKISQAVHFSGRSSVQRT